jgi:hypothetical protein
MNTEFKSIDLKEQGIKEDNIIVFENKRLIIKLTSIVDPDILYKVLKRKLIAIYTELDTPEQVVYYKWQKHNETITLILELTDTNFKYLELAQKYIDYVESIRLLDEPH